MCAVAACVCTFRSKRSIVLLVLLACCFQNLARHQRRRRPHRLQPTLQCCSFYQMVQLLLRPARLKQRWRACLQQLELSPLAPHRWLMRKRCQMLWTSHRQPITAIMHQRLPTPVRQKGEVRASCHCSHLDQRLPRSRLVVATRGESLPHPSSCFVFVVSPLLSLTMNTVPSSMCFGSSASTVRRDEILTARQLALGAFRAAIDEIISRQLQATGEPLAAAAAASSRFDDEGPAAATAEQNDSEPGSGRVQENASAPANTLAVMSAAAASQVLSTFAALAESDAPRWKVRRFMFCFSVAW